MLTFVLKVDYFGLIFYKSVEFDPLDQSLWTKLIEDLNIEDFHEDEFKDYPKTASNDLERWLCAFHASYMYTYEDHSLENLDYESFFKIIPDTKYGEILGTRTPSDVENIPLLTRKKEISKLLSSILCNQKKFNEFVEAEFFVAPNCYENRKHTSAIFDLDGNKLVGSLKFMGENEDD